MKRYAFIGCEVLYREAALCAATTQAVIDLQFLSQGLHDLGSDPMADRLQQAINATDSSRYDAILLGFALCNNGVIGLQAGCSAPLVIPRAHDCISLFLGSARRYQEYFDANPGTYFLTSGWIERDHDNLEDVGDSIVTQMGLGSYDDYVARYGAEAAQWLQETLGDGLMNYSRYAYIRTGFAVDDEYSLKTRKHALERGWEFEEIQGDLRLLRMLFNGDWPEAEYLTVPAGHVVKPCYQGTLMRCQPCLEAS